MRTCLVLSLVFAAAACGDDEPPLTDATSLACPHPGDLPFRMMSRGFARSQNEQLAAEQPRSKDEASDTLGNPGGRVASIYLDDAQPSAAGSIRYRGVKARTQATGGLFSKPLQGERVSLWFYDQGAAAWTAIGRTETDQSGGYELPDTGFVAPNLQPIYAMLEADGSCAEHHDFLVPPGTKVIVTDIDGTLTLNDNELLMEIVDEGYVQVMMGAAARLTNAWAAKRYPVIYLTARPHLLRNETQVWLRDQGFAPGPMITSNGSPDAAVYKTAWLRRMITELGWVPVAVYGNAATDITAYEAAGIPKDRTFIVGELAGMSGTVAIPNLDFSQHISTFVAAQPDNN
jgi:hypothetical protein